MSVHKKKNRKEVGIQSKFTFNLIADKRVIQEIENCSLGQFFTLMKEHTHEKKILGNELMLLLKPNNQPFHSFFMLFCHFEVKNV